MEFPFGHNSKIVSIGSCFAERMAERLLKYRFRCLLNPFGIIFHPVPMLAPLKAALLDQNPFENGYFFSDGTWKNLAFHSRMQHANKDFLTDMVSAGLQATKNGLKTADLLILTLGSAIGFEYLDSGEIAGNCHKLPQKKFKESLSRLSDLRQTLDSFLELLKAENPKIRVLLTVSPVRHLRSGIVENAASKAVLRALCQELVEDYAFVHYFPAWEIMQDDLRDYRFYTSDLVHPSDVAEDYIWEKFAQTWISTDANAINEALDGIFRDLAHRPRDPKSEAHIRFLEVLLDKINRLRNVVDLDMEYVDVEERLGLR